MTTNVFQVYCVHGDGGERGIGPIISYHRTQSQAKTAAQGTGWWGGEGAITNSYMLSIHEDGKFVYYALGQKEPIDLDGTEAKYKEGLIKSALSKLSNEEKRALGL